MYSYSNVPTNVAYVYNSYAQLPMVAGL